MKKSMAILFFGLLLSGAAEAQGKSLYETCGRTLDIVEAFAACADQETACTRQDIEALKTAMGDNRRELMAGIQSGNPSSLIIAPEQGDALLARAENVRGQFMHIQVFGELCNIGLTVCQGALALMSLAIRYWVAFCAYIFITPGFHIVDLAAVALATIVMGAFVLVNMVIGIIGLPAISACLLWWL